MNSLPLRIAASAKLLIIFAAVSLPFTRSLLFPQRNELRHDEALDKLWAFVSEPPDAVGVGHLNEWARIDLTEFSNATVMPVPSAFNDITMDGGLRDYVGWVWYQTTHYIHHDFLPKCSPIVGSGGAAPICRTPVTSSLYFESVNYFARVFINGHEVGSHIGGHLPFELEIVPAVLDVQNPSRILITVAVNNTLSSSTIPPGQPSTRKTADGRTVARQTPNFDFFHYAGILRSVHVVHVPVSRITLAQLQANVDEDDVGVLNYVLNSTLSPEITSRGATQTRFEIALYESGRTTPVIVQRSSHSAGTIRLVNVAKWWPRGYGAPNLYTVELKYLLLIDREPLLLDVYRDTIGFRTITFDDSALYVNYEKFYCIGFGMHEESVIRGRGFDRVFMTKDLNMVEWFGANCYRTSHYPYSEERAREADRRGIAVIVEAPAVGLRNFSLGNQNLHATMLSEMIARDRNRPSVIAWSIANEPSSSKPDAAGYFKALSDHVRQLDGSRPVTAVLNADSSTDQAAQSLDVIGVNRYYGWYSNLGDTDSINGSLVIDIRNWRSRFDKPVFVAEYGAEAIPGLYEDPARPFTEQYQMDVLRQTHKAFDELRRESNLIGEMIWNFADFMTDVSRERMAGNHKGVLTRDRAPKPSAYLIRRRYTAI